MNRKYSPTLIWARVEEFARKRWPEIELRPGALHLHIYIENGHGVFYMYGPKIYFMDDPSSTHFCAADQSAIQDNRNDIREVTLLLRARLRESIVLGETWDEAWGRLAASDGPGRPSKYGEPSVPIAFRLPESLAKRLGDDRNGSALRIVIAALSDSAEDRADAAIDNEFSRLTGRIIE